jgi:hypothetical protein
MFDDESKREGLVERRMLCHISLLNLPKSIL